MNERKNGGVDENSDDEEVKKVVNTSQKGEGPVSILNDSFSVICSLSVFKTSS